MIFFLRWLGRPFDIFAVTWFLCAWRSRMDPTRIAWRLMASFVLRSPHPVAIFVKFLRFSHRFSSSHPTPSPHSHPFLPVISLLLMIHQNTIKAERSYADERWKEVGANGTGLRLGCHQRPSIGGWGLGENPPGSPGHLVSRTHCPHPHR